ncbi:protein eyes shut homolog isoform X2 [Mytilus californianus]|uniref:protein eyes shut homolog isoform X2 n=1 Tax=Mytilus californianus TaxID=6549 RepID=UPI00224840F9|nr:protein eyes shut homolog isoform X2 [Mytilus californianus]
MKMISKLQPGVFFIIIATLFVPVRAQINLALHGTVAQETTYTDKAGISYTANLAIEGPANNNWEDGCSSTGFQPVTWWGLFLPRLAYITNVKSYYRKDEPKRMNDFRLYFANGSAYEQAERCHRDSKKLAYLNLNQSINCDLSPAKNVYFFNRNTFVELCYIEIYDNLAYNGTATQNPLNPNKPASLSIDGNRTNGMCSRTTGSSSYLQVDTGSMSVVTTVYLTYGDPPLTTGDDMIYCSNTSNSWVDGFVLYKGERPTKNINVLAVCRYITFVPPAANGVDVCEIEIGGCPLGRYGVNCEHFCHCKGLCDSVTGQCTLGCFDGWTGERCDKACNNGYFGSECNRTCSKNCIKPSCDHVSGECNEGCIKGWEEYNCTKECDVGYFGWNCSQTCLGCISNKCDKADGSCSIFSGCKPGYVKSQYCNQECEDWFFGINCASRCNCLNNPCNKFNGDCSAERCAKGWQDISCNNECGAGYFGLNCAYVCDTCFNQSCDIFEGNCKVGCNDGYRGRKCETPVSAESLSLIKSSFFMGGFASMLGILLIILTVVIATRRILKKQESGKAINSSHSNFNEQHYDDIMKMESVSTYQDLTKQTVTVSNDYDQINNAYVNQ